MKKTILLSLALLAITLITGCADVTDVHACIPPAQHTYGFWAGVWHSMIAPFSFIGSLFNDDIAVYAINNNGAWYNFGFIGGLGLIIRLIITLIKGLTS